MSFDSIDIGKMEQIFLNNVHPKETVSAIMMRCKNTIVRVRSRDGDTEYFDKIDILVLYRFIICQDDVLRISIDLMKKNGFKLVKEKSIRYSAQTSTGVNSADDKTLLANTLLQADTLLHCLERAASGIDLNVNEDKTVYWLQ